MHEKIPAFLLIKQKIINNGILKNMQFFPTQFNLWRDQNKKKNPEKIEQKPRPSDFRDEEKILQEIQT